MVTRVDDVRQIKHHCVRIAVDSVIRVSSCALEEITNKRRPIKHIYVVAAPGHAYKAVPKLKHESTSTSMMMLLFPFNWPAQARGQFFQIQ